ncbi:HD domain-containing phosphohydrolase [Candidatus Latescibacterota bacterium]
MVRLTDLVGTSDRKKRQGIPSSASPPPQQRRPSGKESNEFLQASDLEGLYDVTGQNTQHVVSPDSGAPVAPGAQVTPFPSPPVDVPVQPQQPMQESSPTQPQPPAVTSQTPTGTTTPETVRPVAQPPVPQSPGQMRAMSAAASQDNYIEEDKKNTDEADSIHLEMLVLLDDVYAEGREGKVVNLTPVIEPIMRLIGICRKANAILRKAIRLKKGGETQTSHSLNACILAIKIGINRGYTDGKLFSLGLCALFGDIGMTRVDPAILNKKGKLEPEEFQEIKNHVKYSRDIALKIANKFPFLAPIVFQIHERENGNGYPEGLRGGNIHEFAKIIGMCDVYIAMTSPKMHRTDFSGYETLQQIISRRGIDFNAGIIKSLIDVISVFPIESLVKLNNGAIGRVIDISAVHPTRPKLLILVDNDGERLKIGKVLDLEKEPLLYIEDPDIEEGAIL